MSDSPTSSPPSQSPFYDPSQHAVVLRSGALLSIADLTEALSLDDANLRDALQNIVAQGGAEHLRLLIEALEIQEKKSIFIEGNADLAILEEAAREFPLSSWLRHMDVPLTGATRQHIISWWETFMTMAREKGFRVSGTIDKISRSTNLWTATDALAEKMRKYQATFRFMPVLLINHPQQVSRLLADLTEAEPFLEVLVGERMEDMRHSVAFLGAFSTVSDDKDAIIRDIPHIIWSVSLALKRT